MGTIRIVRRAGVHHCRDTGYQEKVKSKTMKAIDRRLLFIIVDVVWGDAFEDESVPSTKHARELIQKAIDRRRLEKYSSNRSFVKSVKP